MKSKLLLLIPLLAVSIYFIQDSYISSQTKNKKTTSITLVESFIQGKENTMVVDKGRTSQVRQGLNTLAGYRVLYSTPEGLFSSLGFKVGDLIFEINSKRVKDQDSLKTALMTALQSKKINASYFRKNKKQNLTRHLK